MDQYVTFSTFLAKVRAVPLDINLFYLVGATALFFLF